MDSAFSSILLIIFLSGILLLLLQGRKEFGIRNIVSASSADISLNRFVREGPEEMNSRKNYYFSEESVISMSHRYNGKFDAAILKWDTGPILVSIIERKYPRSILPDKGKPEDVFQASLYVLALKEKGISVKTTQVIVVYCLQDKAIKCMKNGGSLNCIKCGQGKIFKSQFNEKKTLKHLKELDEIWYEGRKPKPKASHDNCRVCPFSNSRKCIHSVV